MKSFPLALVAAFLCLQLSAGAPKPDAGPKYDWDKLTPSKLEEDVDKAAKKCLEALKDKKVLLAPVSAQALDSKASNWGVEKHAEFLFKQKLKAGGMSFVDGAAFFKKLESAAPRGKTAAPLEFSPALLAAAAKETEADAVIVDIFQLATQGGKGSLTAFDTSGSKQLCSADFVLDAADLTPAANTPKLSRSLISWVESQLGKKIGRGECSDLADHALKQVGAKSFGNYKWGHEIPRTSTPLPGDIVQFEKAKIGGSVTDHHTVIVYEVLGPRHFKVLHQNWAGGKEEGRKVGTGSYDLTKWTEGEVHIFRPAKG